jgi:hypothetical protein
VERSAIQEKIRPTSTSDLPPAQDPLPSEITPTAVAVLPTVPQNNPFPSDQGLCDNAYWPLRSGIEWTYNSPDTSFTQRLEEVSNNRVLLSSQYEGQEIRSQLACLEEGLGGNYLGDMRRLTEFGDLDFTNRRGVFLPRSETIGPDADLWVQEFSVTGSVPGYYGTKLISGEIHHGHALARYIPVGFETLDTPLGFREALKVEQRLDLELEINFDLGNQVILVSETANLTNLFWFAQGIGPVKMHWQGGTVKQKLRMNDNLYEQETVVPALANDDLVFVCVFLDSEAASCMSLASTTESDLTKPPETELAIPPVTIPQELLTLSEELIEGETEKPDAGDSSERPSTDIDLPETPMDEDTTDPDGGQAALLEYAESVANLGDRITDLGEEFSEAALAFQDGELTLEEFRDEFSSFKSNVQDPIADIGQLTPPSQAADIHDRLESGLDKCDQAIDLMDAWFDTPNTDLKLKTALLVGQCLEEVDKAKNELSSKIN